MSKKIEEINWDDDFDFDFDEKKEGDRDRAVFLFRRGDLVDPRRGGQNEDGGLFVFVVVDDLDLHAPVFAGSRLHRLDGDPGIGVGEERAGR